MVFYRSLFVYQPSRPRAEARAEAGSEVEVLETTGVEVEMSLLSVWAFLASSSLLVERGRLRQVREPAI